MKTLPLVARPWFSAILFAALMFVGCLAFFDLASAAITAVLAGVFWFLSMMKRNPFANLSQGED